MKTSILALATLAIGCHAACYNSSRVDGMIRAYCIDEDTGKDFHMVDISGYMEHTLGMHPEDNAGVYAAYLDGRGEHNSTALDKRSLTTYWNDCKDFVSGVCANDHVSNWVGSLSTFATAITAIFAKIQQATRSDDSPRSICTNYNGDGTICVSWNVYYADKLTSDQVKAIAHECTYVCEQQDNSCESKTVTDHTTVYHCVSNRADHCSANGKIRKC